LAGYDLIVAREVFVYHEGSYSFQKNQVDYLKYLNKNLQRFKQKWKGEIEFRGEHYFFKRDLKRIALQEISNGEKAFARNEIDKAATHFQKALEWDPESAQALNNLGVVHFLKGNYGKARECLLKAIDLDKTYEDAWRNFLSLPPEQESWKKLAFRAAKISWNKEMVATLFGFARTAWEMGWENVARAFGDAVREGDADSVEARLLGVLERWYGQDAAGALNLLDQISRAAPNHPEVIRLYAQFSALLGNADDAVQLLEEFLRQQPHPELESLLNEIKRLPARQAVEEGVDFHE
jgi:tetratricopeptide (TPR) repeat protein